MFSNFFLKSFRILLLPFSLLYWAGISIRNWLYDRGFSKSASFGLPLICVGNLSVGGTGKSPMVEYLVRLLRDQFNVATLSRGYKRKTKGYALAGPQSTALEIGDEPMQFHLKFPDVPVAVGEERIVAIPQLLHDRPETRVIVLDDAFQHRAVKAGLNILLTDYSNLYTRDFYLPTGDLRDLKSGAGRAQIIVVTKCPPDLDTQKRNAVVAELKPLPGQQVFFTTIEYGQLYQIMGQRVQPPSLDTEILLVTGIANPKPLEKHLVQYCKSYHLQSYADHHIFTIDDLRDIRKKFDDLDTPGKIILTTEKDAVRLSKFSAEIGDWPFFVIPVRHRFLFGQEADFNARVINFIKEFTPQTTTYGKKK